MGCGTDESMEKRDEKKEISEMAKEGSEEITQTTWMAELLQQFEQQRQQDVDGCVPPFTTVDVGQGLRVEQHASEMDGIPLPYINFLEFFASESNRAQLYDELQRDIHNPSSNNVHHLLQLFWDTINVRFQAGKIAQNQWIENRRLMDIRDAAINAIEQLPGDAKEYQQCRRRLKYVEDNIRIGISYTDFDIDMARTLFEQTERQRRVVYRLLVDNGLFSICNRTFSRYGHGVIFNSGPHDDDNLFIPSYESLDPTCYDVPYPNQPFPPSGT
jgi:hypothetical protein